MTWGRGPDPHAKGQQTLACPESSVPAIPAAAEPPVVLSPKPPPVHRAGAQRSGALSSRNAAKPKSSTLAAQSLPLDKSVGKPAVTRRESLHWLAGLGRHDLHPM